jgi:GT2 family glycosyltransferase
MTDVGASWVGVLDVGRRVVIPMGDPAPADRGIARVLVRLHGAPLGYVEIPFEPAGTLGSRAEAAAATSLADELRRHGEAHQDADGSPGRLDWTAQLSCPANFPSGDGAGLSIIVCTRDRPAALAECLRSLQRADYEPLEILVIDNAPTDAATREQVEQFALDDPRIRYSCEPAPGLSTARNHGLAAAKYDLVAFTDDDILVDPRWPAALMAGFAADPAAACVTGLVAPRSLQTAAERYFDSRYSWGKAFDACRYDLAAHRDVSALYPFKAGLFGTGANFAIRRSVVERLGGFDTILGAGGPGRGGEDLDMFVRLILGGERLCYLPAALVWHQHRASDQALTEQVYSYGHGLGAYLAKRLVTREMPVSTLLRSAGQAVLMAGQMRHASRSTQLRARGRQLATTEARGVLAGALCFYRAARRQRVR